MKLNLRQPGRGLLGKSLGVIILAIASPIYLNLPTQAQVLTLQGNTAGQWGMPSNPSGSTFLSAESGGINNRLTWGKTDNCFNCTSFNNYVQYDGLGFQTGVGSLFRLGDLSYRNGSVWDPFNGDFSLGIALNFANPTLGTQNFDFLFNIFNSPNVTGNAVLDGDRLRFSNSGISSQTFTLGNSIYNLQLIGFSSDGGATLVREFNSPEGTTARASLYGQIQEIGSIPAPPAPSPSPVIPSPAPVVVPVIASSSPSPAPVVTSSGESPDVPIDVSESPTILGMLLGIGFLVRARLLRLGK